MTPLLVLILSLATSGLAAPEQFVTDSNAAVFEGEERTYVFTAPQALQLNMDEAGHDGYSFAFIPKLQTYDTAQMLVGVNIYKIRALPFDSVLAHDTAGLRVHFGDDITITARTPVRTPTSEKLQVFAIEAPTRFTPNRMIAYFDGGTELIIFELVISPTCFSSKAEEIYLTCLSQFKPLKRGTLGEKR